MKTVYYTATSVDGYIADEQSSLGWLFQFSDDSSDEGDESDEGYETFVADVGAVVMGSSTYEWILAEEIKDDPGRWPYAQPTWVFSSRDLRGIPGADIRFVRGPVEPVHAEIAALLPEGKDLWVAGGGELVGLFLDAGLVDEIRLGVAPVFLGGGAPLLPRRLVTPPLVLEECRQAGPFVQLRYRVEHERRPEPDRP